MASVDELQGSTAKITSHLDRLQTVEKDLAALKAAVPQKEDVGKVRSEMKKVYVSRARAGVGVPGGRAEGKGLERSGWQKEAGQVPSVHWGRSWRRATAKGGMGQKRRGARGRWEPKEGGARRGDDRAMKETCGEFQNALLKHARAQLTPGRPPPRAPRPARARLGRRAGRSEARQVG
jgi:hypothetical protein